MPPDRLPAAPVMALVLGALLLGSVAGCASSVKSPASPDLQRVYEAYHAGNHELAYALARDIAASGDGQTAKEAAYMAGMSAYQLGRSSQAEYYLSHAARSEDPALAADAKAGLGLVYLQQGRTVAAESQLREAAGKMTGQNRANAYFYAGLAQQRQGLWNEARASFIQARALSSDPVFREQCHQQLAYTGYTLQAGAFTQLTNAQRLAQQWNSRAQQAGLGLPRVVKAVGSDGKTLYLVQIGQFSTHNSAAAARARVGTGTTIIVPMQSPKP